MFTHLVNYKKRGHFDKCTPTIDIEPSFLFLKDKKEKLYVLLLPHSRSHSPLQSGHCHLITRSASRLDMPFFLLKWVALPQWCCSSFGIGFPCRLAPQKGQSSLRSSMFFHVLPKVRMSFFIFRNDKSSVNNPVLDDFRYDIFFARAQ